MTTEKKVPAEMWEEIYRVSAHAQEDHTYSVRQALITVGERHGFTEADLIAAQVINEPPKPKPGALKGSRRA